MENYIIIGIIALIVALAVVYVVRAKKKGQKCIGCPSGGCCSGKKDKSSCCCYGNNNNE